MAGRSMCTAVLLVSLISLLYSVHANHSWMDKVPLKKLDKKSKLTGRGGSKGYAMNGRSEETVALSLSAETLADDMSWEVVEPDGTLYEGKLTKETMDMIINANRVQGKRRKRMASKGPENARARDSGTFHGASSRVIVGPDDRRDILCGDEDIYPFSGVVRISDNLDSAFGGDCSGLLIGPRHVLTAGHCVHDGRGGDWVDSRMKFRPQQNCYPGHAPLGTYEWETIWAVNGWTKRSRFQFDYALVILSRPVNTWVAFGFNDRVRPGRSIYVNGYPMQDKLDYDMWQSSGTISRKKKFQYESTNLDIVPGNSGSGMLYYDRGDWVAIGVAAAEVTCRPGIRCQEKNLFTRITGERFEQICGWMDTDLC